MNCRECNPLIGAYHDGELDAVNSIDVERHLKSCPVCANALARVDAVHNAFQNPALSYSAPFELRQKVAAISQKVNRTGSRSRGFVWSLPSFSFGAIAGMVAVLICAVVISLPVRSPNDEVVAAHVRSLMAEHLTDVASTDSHTVKPWFAGKVDFSAPVKDFADRGFPLVGGRLDYIRGRPVMALVYKRNRHVVNVFISPLQDAKARATQVKVERGFTVATKKSNGLEFSAVSDLNQTELSQLLEFVAE